MAKDIVTEGSPFVLRDFRQGRITPSAISEYLLPQNSVKNSVNVNFDTIVGSAVVRPGTTTTGTVASGKSPLGLGEYVGKSGTPNYMLSVFKGASNATAYYYDGTWHATNKTSLSNSAKNRFAVLGGSAFMTNNVDGMFDSPQGTTFGTSNSIPTVKPSLVYRYNARLLASGDLNFPSRVYFSSIVASANYTFTVTSANATIGATYTNNGQTFTVVATIASGTTLLMTGTGTPGASGTLTKASGTGDSSIAFSVAANVFITWNVNPSTGDWIDINPDDGGYNTAFSETSTFALVFKNNAMYRLDTVNKSTDPQNIFNIGAVSQEAVVACQGLVYFFSGTDIRQTDGGFPQQISRAAIQDIIDAIPQANWADVAAGQDGLNVYFFVGDVTLNTSMSSQVTISNCALKFSPRDQSWSVHSYASKNLFLTLYTDTNGRKMRGADTGGLVQTINLGATDNGVAISYSLETQDLEFGNRGHLKSSADKITAFLFNGAKSTLQAKVDGEVTKLDIALNEAVNYSKPSTLTFHWLNLLWFGTSSATSPIFGGMQMESVQDNGSTNQ